MIRTIIRFFRERKQRRLAERLAFYRSWIGKRLIGKIVIKNDVDEWKAKPLQGIVEDVAQYTDRKPGYTRELAYFVKVDGKWYRIGHKTDDLCVGGIIDESRPAPKLKVA